MEKQTFDTDIRKNKQHTRLEQFEFIYKKIKHFFVGLFFIFSCSLVILLAISVLYFQNLTKEATHMSDNELKHKLLNVSGNEDIDYKSDNILSEYNNSINTLIVGPKHVNSNVIKALTASEDSLFFQHNGILPKAVLRAIGQDIFNSMDATGGSTITQQLVKNQVLTNKKTYNRKANELVLSMRAEKILTKDEILYTYLNIVPFGRDYHGTNISGIGSAAYSIFGKPAEDLNIAESAYLVGLLQSPYYYTPYNEDGSLNPSDQIQVSLNRQHYVLKRMLVEDEITLYDYRRAENYDIKSHLMTK